MSESPGLAQTAERMRGHYVVLMLSSIANGRLAYFSMTARASRSLVIAVAIALTGCADSGPSTNVPRPESARRIVVVAPAAAEMLEAIGAIDRVVGIGDYVREPASIAGLPRVGAYDSPNVERVLELGTDLLITASGEAAAESQRQLESLGLRVLALDTSTYEGVFESIARVGDAVGRAPQAEHVSRGIRDALASIGARVEGLPRRKVLFVVGRDPAYVAGPGSHIDEMIALAGGTNVAGDAGSPYARMSMEAILERMPEVIVDTSDNRPGAPRGRHAGHWAEWEFLPAVRDGRVYQVDPPRLVIPGIRLPEMTELMASLVHPEVFGETADSDLGAR